MNELLRRLGTSEAAEPADNKDDNVTYASERLGGAVRAEGQEGVGSHVLGEYRKFDTTTEAHLDSMTQAERAQAAIDAARRDITEALGGPVVAERNDPPVHPVEHDIPQENPFDRLKG